MVIVMPSLSTGENGNDDVVAAVVGCIVVAVAPQMSHGIDRPREMPHEHSSEPSAPYQQARAKLESSSGRSTAYDYTGKTGDKKDKPRCQSNFYPVIGRLKPRVEGIVEQIRRVTSFELACVRIVTLDNQPTDVAPEKALQRTVGVAFLVCRMMMQSVPCRPNRWRFLKTTHPENDDRPLHPTWRRKTSMSRKPVITDVHAKPAEYVTPDGGKDDASPAEEPGEAREQCKEVDERDWRGISPFDRPSRRSPRLSSVGQQRLAIDEEIRIVVLSEG